MRKLFILSGLIIFAIGCGSKTSKKIDEVCDCVDSKQTPKSTALETFAALDECTKNLVEDIQDYTREEKEEMHIKVNACIKTACEGKGMKYEISLREQ